MPREAIVKLPKPIPPNGVLNIPRIRSNAPSKALTKAAPADRASATIAFVAVSNAALVLRHAAATVSAAWWFRFSTRMPPVALACACIASVLAKKPALVLSQAVPTLSAAVAIFRVSFASSPRDSFDRALKELTTALRGSSTALKGEARDDAAVAIAPKLLLASLASSPNDFRNVAPALPASLKAVPLAAIDRLSCL